MLLKVISEITTEKQTKGIFPTHALINEVALKMGLSHSEVIELLKVKGLKMGRTINSNYIKI